jgi:hypothetical protein
MIKPGFQAAMRKRERQNQLAAAAFVQACKAGDVQEMLKAVDQINGYTVAGWTDAMRMIACEVPEVTLEIQQSFLWVWVQTKMLLLTVRDHQALCAAARVLMPCYKGPPVQLFRGASADERRRRIYGVSWTTDIEIAEEFAQERREWNGGSVVLETIAEPAAIICAVGEASGHLYEENEYAVDRRHLNSVKVVRRYPQIDLVTDIAAQRMGKLAD